MVATREGEGERGMMTGTQEDVKLHKCNYIEPHRHTLRGNVTDIPSDWRRNGRTDHTALTTHCHRDMAVIRNTITPEAIIIGRNGQDETRQRKRKR